MGMSDWRKLRPVGLVMPIPMNFTNLTVRSVPVCYTNGFQNLAFLCLFPVKFERLFPNHLDFDMI